MKLSSTGAVSEPVPGSIGTRGVQAGSHGQEEYRFLKGMITGMRCGIITVNRTGALVMINDPAVHILELERVPSCGVPIAEAIPAYPQLAQVLMESFNMSTLPNRAEIELRFDADRTKTIGFTLSHVAGRDDAAEGVALFFKDLTHVEHHEVQERLRDRLAALGQMSANLAHEIRNPLASIEVTCSLLKRRIGSEESGMDLLDKIIAEVRRLNRTIASSLEFVRPLSLNLGLHTIGPVLEEALEVAEGRWGSPGIRVSRRLAGDLPPFLMDRGKVRQVFENLLLNAMEAMGDEGVLTVETGTQPAPVSATTPYPPEGAHGDPWRDFDRYVIVRIADTGCGIDEQHAEKLFYPFFTTKKNGSGVGLPMAKKIVDQHRGLIDVESTPGRGSVFTVRLPMVGSSEEIVP